MGYTINQILKENWSSYVKNHEVKDYQKKEVEKTIDCSKRSCNGRICTSCGKRYSDSWSDKIGNFLFPIKHRHVVLTVPAKLRDKLRDWNNVKIFMDASNRFLKYLNTKDASSIVILHTFGKDLKFNPHLHIIAPISKQNQDKFSKIWRNEVLKALCIYDFDDYKYGFYVWIENDNIKNDKKLKKYVSFMK